MKLQKTKEGLILSLESSLEEESISKILEGKNRMIYQIQMIDSDVKFVELGKKEDVCNLSENITYSTEDENIQLISNLGQTPFTLNGIIYQSVEAFLARPKNRRPGRKARNSTTVWKIG